MASEHPGEASVSLTIPDSLSDWLDDVAQAENLSREDVLLRLLSAYRQVDGPDDADGAIDGGELEVRPTDGPADEFVSELRSDIESMVDEELGERGPEGPSDEELQARVESAVETALRSEDGPLDAAVAAALDADDGPLADAVESALADEDGAVGDRLVEREALDERVDEVDDRFTDLLEDVRERVVQVKRETDEKAPAEHDHPELAERVATLSADLEDLSDAVDSVDDRVDAGFENFEEVLSYLTDSIDELSARQTTLARAVVEIREELRAIAAKEAARSAVDDLRLEANRHGISNAACEECERQVDLGLLTRPQCPHCSATMTGVEPARGFFGNHRLATGDRPALEPGEAEPAGFEFAVGDIIDSESPAPDTGDGDVTDADG